MFVWKRRRLRSKQSPIVAVLLESPERFHKMTWSWSNLDPLHRESSGPCSDFQTLGAAPLISQEQNISVLLDVIFMPRCDYNKRLQMVTPLQERDPLTTPNF